MRHLPDAWNVLFNKSTASPDAINTSPNNKPTTSVKPTTATRKHDHKADQAMRAALHFRTTQNIIISDELIQAAVIRYQRARETTIFVSSRGHDQREVLTYTAKPCSDLRNLRCSTFFEYAYRLEQRRRQSIDGSMITDKLTHRNDLMRVYMAFYALHDCSLHKKSTLPIELRNLEQSALHLLIDLSPGAMLIHGNIQKTPDLIFYQFDSMTSPEC